MGDSILFIKTKEQKKKKKGMEKEGGVVEEEPNVRDMRLEYSEFLVYMLLDIRLLSFPFPAN